jgi:steroid delta-isomerase-like uncharacterized protein
VFTVEQVFVDAPAASRGAAWPNCLPARRVRLRAAFPDLQLSIQDQLAEDGRLAIRYVGQGTHQGEFLGIPATGRKVSYTGMLMVRLEDGRIAEFWAQPDLLGVLRQLGATVS